MLLFGYLLGFKSGKKDEKLNYELKTIPFYKSHDKGLKFWKKTVVKVGYFQQLYVSGIPSMTPVEIVINEKAFEEVDEVALLSYATKLVTTSLGGNTSGIINILQAMPFEEAKQLLKK
ncbi:hypothetical protein GPEL0_01r4080 [Geoanaerobacter pelophilus]|uniref:Uncharacterized protein n=2 Tax=Geoanaerobacter pelophilus TaxID=60036 RepID=A0ABQ0MLN1_9BACT|nr:hypothetical protein GPEL0_01r4080 [Geoanaerobacter pelophilus]